MAPMQCVWLGTWVPRCLRTLHGILSVSPHCGPTHAKLPCSAFGMCTLPCGERQCGDLHNDDEFAACSVRQPQCHSGPGICHVRPRDADDRVAGGAAPEISVRPLQPVAEQRGIRGWAGPWPRTLDCFQYRLLASPSPRLRLPAAAAVGGGAGNPRPEGLAFLLHMRSSNPYMEVRDPRWRAGYERAC